MIEQLRDLEGRGLLLSKEHPDLPLLLWLATDDSRGTDADAFHCTVTTVDGEIVGRSWPRPLRVGDANATPAMPSRKITAYDKVDGAAVLVALHEDSLLIWSADGWSVDERIAPALTGWKPAIGETVLFEAVYPGLSKVIEYEFEGLVLIGAVNHETLHDAEQPDVVAQRTGWPGEIAVLRTVPFSWLVDICADPANGEGREGFVVVRPQPSASAVRTIVQFEWWKRARADRR